MDDFELNKLGWFTVQNVEPNAFLNDKLDNDTYGIWYSVKFAGDANTHLWQAKTAPVEGEKYYGHIEKTKSGKATKFRRAKKDDTPHEAGSPKSTPTSKYHPKDDHTQESIARSVALKAAVDIIASGKGVHGETVFDIAEKFLAWLQNSGTQETGNTTADDSKPPARPWTKVGKGRDEDAEEQSLYNSIAEAEQFQEETPFDH